MDDNERLCSMEPAYGEEDFASSGTRIRDRWLSRPALNELLGLLKFTESIYMSVTYKVCKSKLTDSHNMFFLRHIFWENMFIKY